MGLQGAGNPEPRHPPQKIDLHYRQNGKTGQVSTMVLAYGI